MESNIIKRKFDPPISPTSTINVGDTGISDDDDDVEYIGTIAGYQSEVNNEMTSLTSNFTQIPSLLVTPPQSPPEVEHTHPQNIHISHDQDSQPRNDEMPTLRALLTMNDVEKLNVPCFLCQRPFSDYESLRDHLGQHAAQLISLNSPVTVVSVPTSPPDTPLSLLPNYPIVPPQTFPPNYSLVPPPPYSIVAPPSYPIPSHLDFTRVPHQVFPGVFPSNIPSVPYPDVPRVPLPNNPSLSDNQRFSHPDIPRVAPQEEEVYPPDFLRMSLTHAPVVTPPATTVPPPAETESINTTCFRCNTCHKMLISKTSLLLHQKIHHKSLQAIAPMKPVAPRSKQLKKRVRKPFRCNVCKKGYRRYVNLSKHILLRHGILPIKSRQENPEEPTANESQKRIVWSTNLLNAVAAADYNPAAEKVDRYLPPDVGGASLDKTAKQKYALRSPYCNPNLWIDYDDHVP